MSDADSKKILNAYNKTKNVVNKEKINKIYEERKKKGYDTIEHIKKINPVLIHPAVPINRMSNGRVPNENDAINYVKIFR